MLSAYPACFFKEETGYSVIFPDLNYLATCGETMEEAFVMAVDCLAGYLYISEMEGETVPPASDLKAVDPAKLAAELEFDYEKEASQVLVNLVTVDVAAYAKTHFEKAVKKTLTVPAWLNKMALEQSLNFSQVLQEALKEKVLTQRKNMTPADGNRTK